MPANLREALILRASYDNSAFLILVQQRRRTLVLTDAAFHFDESFPFVTQLATRVLGGYKSLSPSFLEKVATTKKEKVSQSIKEILSWDFDRVVMAHGSIIERDGKEKLREGYRTFLQ